MRDRTSSLSLISIVILSLALTAGSWPKEAAQQSNRVGLVVTFGDGSVVTRCIEFVEAEISGYEALKRAGFSLVTSFDAGMGAGICKIEDEGCPKASCMTCDTPNYWSYWHLDAGTWTYSQLGASGHAVQNGDVDGWRWGTGDPPSVVTFEQICAPPTDTPVPTNTPIPPTNTPIPTNTPVPATETPAPTAVPAPEAWFRLDENPIAAGSCTMLRWDTSHATEAYVDGEPVSIIGSREVCPTATTDYVLRIVGPEQEQTYQLTLGVTGSAPATATPRPAAVTPSPTADEEETAPSTPTPTSQDTRSSPASSTLGDEAAAPSSATPEPSASPRPSPSPSPSAKPAEIAQAEPTATAIQVAETDNSEDEAVRADQGVKLPGDDPPSVLQPTGYIVFSLIVGGLLGWLIYILRSRGQRA